MATRPKVTQRFFFYGTLQGQRYAGLVYRSPAFIDNCKLVTANGYPAAILNSTGVLKGEIVEIKGTQRYIKDLIHNFDQWETNYNNNPKTSFYLRTNVQVRLPSNRRTDALMYYINLNGRYSYMIDHEDVIPNGDWLQHIRKEHEHG